MSQLAISQWKISIHMSHLPNSTTAGDQVTLQGTKAPEARRRLSYPSESQGATQYKDGVFSVWSISL